VSDALRYRLIDEPRPGPLQRFALPPLLVFLAATYFMPWGLLLIAANSVALNGPHRNREIVFSVIPIAIYFVALAALSALAGAGTIEVNQARYLLVAAIGAGLVFAAMAYVSQYQSAELRRYLQQ
jgi:hypothetical protein